MKVFTKLGLTLLMVFFTSSVILAEYSDSDDPAEKQNVISFQETDASPTVSTEKFPTTDATWDLQFSFDVDAATGAAGNAGAECDGNNYYTTRWASNLIHKYDLTGVMVLEFSVPGVTGLRDLAFDGTYFYGGAASTTIYEMDFATPSLVSSISSPQQVRTIAYDEVQDAFWVSNFGTDITLVSKAGVQLAVIPNTTLTGKYGSAYDGWTPGGPYLWVFAQGAGAGTPQFIHQYDLNTLAATGFTYDVLTDLGPNASAIAGGLFTIPDVYPGTASIGGLLQGTPDTYFVYELELTGPLPDDDLGVQTIISPVSGNNLSGAEEVTIAVKNFGDATQTSFDVSFAIDGGTAVVESVTTTLNSGDTYDYTFTATANLSALGDHMIEACVILTGDENTANDCKDATITNSNIQSMTVYPQSVDYWTGTTDGAAYTETSLVKGYGLTSDAYMIFDISSIPAGSTINSIEFNGYCYETNYPYWSVTPCYMDPLTTSAADLRAHIETFGTSAVDYYYGNEASTYAPGWKVYDLINSATMDMEAALAQGWFAVGVLERDASDTYFVSFEGWNETNMPFLVVDYEGSGPVLDPPENFNAVVQDDINVYCTWNAPAVEGDWIQWDAGTNNGTGIGLTSGGTLYAASRWEPADLVDYDGMNITKISFYPNGDPAATFELFAWTGADAGTQIMNQPVASFMVDEFNEITLDVPITIDASDELWFGYSCTHAAGTLPAGRDDGPALPFNGDMLSTDGVTWVSMATAYSLNYNWNLAAYVVPTDDAITAKPMVKATVSSIPNPSFVTNEATGISKKFTPSSSKALLGYNVYYDGGFIDYTTDLEYLHLNVPSGTWDYWATAVYDDGESGPSNTDEVTIEGGVDPPTDFDATVQDIDDVYCTWEAPGGSTLSEIAYDDGTAEQWFWYGDPSSTDHMFYTRFTAPEDGMIEEFTLLDAANVVMDWNQIMICPDNGAGAPDLTSPYETYPDVEVSTTITNGGEWELFVLTVPFSVTAGDDFFVVTNWPDGSSDGPFVGTDNSAADSRSAYSADAGASWTVFTGGDWIIRAYYSTGEENFSGLTVVPQVNAQNITLPVSTIANPVTNSTQSYVVPLIVSESTKDLLGYNVYNDDVGLVGYTTETFYLDEDLDPGTYTYWATAVYDAGESVPSNTDEVTVYSGPVSSFFDDFESGPSQWVFTGDWGITDEQSYSPSNSLADSPGGNYLPNLETYATMAVGIDLSDPGILSANVIWWMIMDIENGNFDYLYVEASDDNFATFTTIATFFGEGMLDPWIEYSYPLGAFIGSGDVKVRFHFSSDGGYEVDGCYIDDFLIETSDVDNAPPEVFFDAPFAYEGTIDDYVVEAEILDVSGVASAEVLYTVDGVAQANVTGVNTSGDMWEFTIPQQDPGYQVDFQITAVDGSPNANEALTDTASYIAGEYIGYDNAIVDFYTEIGPAGTGGILGSAVVFTVSEPSQLVTALIRNYMDQSVGANDEMVVHIWSDGGTGPGVDLIPPITMMPEANLVHTRAFTRVDLRPYAAQLSSIEGDIFVGFTVPAGVVRTTITQPGIANRSFQSIDGITFTAITDDYHYRIIVGEGSPNPIPPPTDLTAMEDGEDIVLNWTAPGSGGGTEELIYDNDVSTGAYSYTGYTMGTQMSPAGPCKVLTMKFYTTTQAGDNDFNATIFDWAGSQPGTDIIYEENVIAMNEEWLEVDISAQNITFDGDFVVGFGSVNATTFLGYDAGLNNGRSWDFDNTGLTWASWSEAYLIRAIVEYTDGTVAEIGTSTTTVAKSGNNSVHSKDYSGVTIVEPIPNQAGQSKELIGYNVYYGFNSATPAMIEEEWTETTYTHVDAAVIGLHTYYVTAVYDEGESVPSNEAELLITSVEDQLVNSTVVYPNPASNAVNIKSDFEIESIIIYNHSGQVISNEQVQTKMYQINTSQYTPGLYFFQVETTEGTISKRIIIQ